MARKKHPKKTARASHLADVADLDRSGLSQRTIAAMLGISQPQVCYDLKRLHAHYLKTANIHHTAKVAEKREQYRELRAYTWRLLEKSNQEFTKTTREKIESDGKGDKGKAGRAKVSVQTESHVGDAAYVGRILDILKAECELDGLNAPKKKHDDGDPAARNGEPPQRIKLVEIVAPLDASLPTDGCDAAQPSRDHVVNDMLSCSAQLVP